MAGESVLVKEDARGSGSLDAFLVRGGAWIVVVSEVKDGAGDGLRVRIWERGGEEVGMLRADLRRIGGSA